MKATRRRGYLIPLALVLMVVMLALMAVLHHYETVGRRAWTYTEADLQLQQTRQWALAQTLGLLPSGVQQRSSDVSMTLPKPVTSDSVPLNYGARALGLDSDGRWSGLANLAVARKPLTQLDPTVDAGPGTYRYNAVRPRSNGFGFDVFGGRTLTESVTQWNFCAAAAPHGSVYLDEVAAFANPYFGEQNANQQWSGQRAVVAAAETVNVNRLRYGSAYSQAGVVQLGAGSLAFAGGQTAFPAGTLNDSFWSSLEFARTSLKTTALTLDNKTEFLGATRFTQILDDLVHFRVPNLKAGISLRSSVEFTCPTFPWFGRSSIPMPSVPPFIVFIFEQSFWFHAPFPPDGSTLNKADVDAIQKRITELHQARARKEAMLRMLMGGEAIPPQKEVEVPGRPAEPGLIKSYEALRPSLTADLELLRVNAENPNAPLLTSLSTPSDLLIWLAHFSPRGYFNADGNLLPGIYPTDAVWPSLNTDPEAALVAESLSKLFPQLSDQFSNQKDSKGYLLPPTTTWQGQVIRPGQALPQNFWATALPEGPGSPGERQFRMVQLLWNTWNFNNPLTKAVRLADELRRRIGSDSIAIDKANRQMDEIYAKAIAESNEKIPKTRDEDKKLPDGGQPGRAYARYGYSYDVFYHVIKDLIDGNISDRWQQDWPMVLFGTRTFRHNFGLAGNTTIMKASVNVPAGRSLYCGRAMTLEGDLWIQRGATMTVAGDLRLVAPPEFKKEEVLKRVKKSPFPPCGRIMLEEGASLVVEGDLTCEGTAERGSLCVVGPLDGIHPITSAVFCSGTLTLPHGTQTWVDLSDTISSFGSVAAKFGSAFRLLTQEVAPVAAKVAGPFHTRKSFFCAECPTYNAGVLSVFVPIFVPWPDTHVNKWVGLANVITRFCAVADNFQFGENTVLHTDWWPLQREDQYFGYGLPSLLPKLDYKTRVKKITIINLDDLLSKFNELAEKMLLAAWERMVKFVDDALTELLKKLLNPLDNSSKPSPTEESISWLEDLRKQLVENGPIDFLLNKAAEFIDSQIEFFSEEEQAHECSGVLLSAGKQLVVGVPGSEARAKRVAGLLVAGGDIYLHTEYTVGVVVSRTGSINPPASRARTSLLYYPPFSVASLHNPRAVTDFSQQSFVRQLPAFIQRAVDYHFGPHTEPGTALDVRFTTAARSQAGGWER